LIVLFLPAVKLSGIVLLAWLILAKLLKFRILKGTIEAYRVMVLIDQPSVQQYLLPCYIYWLRWRYP
jgi:hypothetical protein